MFFYELFSSLHFLWEFFLTFVLPASGAGALQRFLPPWVNVPLVVPGEGVHIDNAWVDVDVSNILPERTRGAR